MQRRVAVGPRIRSGTLGARTDLKRVGASRFQEMDCRVLNGCRARKRSRGTGERGGWIYFLFNPPRDPNLGVLGFVSPPTLTFSKNRAFRNMPSSPSSPSNPLPAPVDWAVTFGNQLRYLRATLEGETPETRSARLEQELRTGLQ